MRVHVTARDIARGKRLSPTGCPVARAIRRRYFWMARVSVFGQHAHVLGRDVVLPPSVQAFVANFDELLFVHPFSFEM